MGLTHLCLLQRWRGVFCASGRCRDHMLCMSVLRIVINYNINCNDCNYVNFINYICRLIKTLCNWVQKLRWVILPDTDITVASLNSLHDLALDCIIIIIIFIFICQEANSTIEKQNKVLKFKSKTLHSLYHMNCTLFLIKVTKVVQSRAVNNGLLFFTTIKGQIQQQVY